MDSEKWQLSGIQCWTCWIFLLHTTQSNESLLSLLLNRGRWTWDSFYIWNESLRISLYNSALRYLCPHRFAASSAHDQTAVIPRITGLSDCHVHLAWIDWINITTVSRRENWINLRVLANGLFLGCFTPPHDLGCQKYSVACDNDNSE